MNANENRRYAHRKLQLRLPTFFYALYFYKQLLMVCFILCLKNELVAGTQDSVYLKDKQILYGKIAALNSNQLIFNWKNIDTRINLLIPISEVDKVRYKNGKTLLFDSISNFSTTTLQPTMMVNGFADLPIIAEQNDYFLNRKPIGQNRINLFLLSRNDSSLFPIVSLVKKEKAQHIKSLVTYVILEIPAVALAAIYVSSVALENLGVYGIRSNENLMIISASITAAALPVLFYSLRKRYFKNEHRREVAKLYNKNYFIRRKIIFQ
jgi:hypothetical protein